MANPNPPTHQLPKLQPGQTMNPLGNGCARTRITNKFIRDMADYYDVHGPDVIHEVRMKDPVALLNVVARLLPKETHLNISGDVSVDLTKEQRLRIAEAWMMGQSDKLEALEGEAIRLIDEGRESLDIKRGLPKPETLILSDAETEILSELEEGAQDGNEPPDLDSPPPRVAEPVVRLKRGQRAVISRRKSLGD